MAEVKELSRQARKQSETGLHHVLVQGPRQQAVFKQPENKAKYLETIQKYFDQGKVILYAYCIMDNSAHLVLEEREDTVTVFMRRVGVSYVHWYNKTWEREGSLFRERYQSKPIRSQEEFLKVIRFVHQLPVRYGKVQNMWDYPWSSYGVYMRISTEADIKREVLEQLGDWSYERYMNDNWREIYLRETSASYGKSDQTAMEQIRKRLDGRPVDDLKCMKQKVRNELLARMRFEDQISIGQLSRLTGIGRGIIQKLKPAAIEEYNQEQTRESKIAE